VRVNGGLFLQVLHSRLHPKHNFVRKKKNCYLHGCRARVRVLRLGLGLGLGLGYIESLLDDGSVAFSISS
jgi:hypothetical protein